MFQQDNGDGISKLYVPLPDKCSIQAHGELKIWAKDESKRFHLNAYKFLGVSYSLALELSDDSGGKLL